MLILNKLQNIGGGNLTAVQISGLRVNLTKTEKNIQLSCDSLIKRFLFLSTCTSRKIALFDFPVARCLEKGMATLVSSVPVKEVLFLSTHTSRKIALFDFPVARCLENGMATKVSSVPVKIGPVL